MAELEVIYKNSKIVETDLAGIKTLNTSGKYCEDNIEIKYTRPSFQNSFILLKANEGALLTCGNQTYQLSANENEHSFLVEPGTYIVTATINGQTNSDTVLVDISGVYEVNLYIGRLPIGYEEREYLQSTGTQYIDVGFKPNQDTSMEVNFLLTDFSNYPPISNSRNTAITGYFGMSVLDSDTFRFLYYNSLNDLNVSTLNTFNTYLLDKNKMYINGEAKGEFTYRNFQVIHNLYIFADNINGSIARYSKMKLKSYRLKDNGEIIRNLIPCIRNRDSEPGLYDIVTNEFYTNQGSGEFVVGGIV